MVATQRRPRAALTLHAQGLTRTARRIEGFAIVSADGMTANAAGDMPDALKFESDKRFFERGLDRVDVVVHAGSTSSCTGATPMSGSRTHICAAG
jgi:hypothetical protein